MKTIQGFIPTILKLILHHLEDLNSLRVLLNWVYSIFYIILVLFCVFLNKASADTAITATATLVGAIFTSYVFSKTYEKTKTNSKK